MILFLNRNYSRGIIKSPTTIHSTIDVRFGVVAIKRLLGSLCLGKNLVNSNCAARIEASEGDNE